LKKAVSYEVEDGGTVSSHAGCGEHVAELTDSGIGQHFLDVILIYCHGGGEKGCQHSNHSHH
jgi:hypothetical protein